MYTYGPAIDAQNHLERWLCSEMPSLDNSWSGRNIHRGCNEEYDTLFAELTETPMGQERNELIMQLNDVVIQNYYLIPLVERSNVSAFSRTLTGYQMNGWDSELWNIGEWQRR